MYVYIYRKIGPKCGKWPWDYGCLKNVGSVILSPKNVWGWTSKMMCNPPPPPTHTHVAATSVYCTIVETALIGSIQIYYLSLCSILSRENIYWTRIVCIRPKGRTQCIFPRSQHSCLYDLPNIAVSMTFFVCEQGEKLYVYICIDQKWIYIKL